jgi:hypothetical protein
MRPINKGIPQSYNPNKPAVTDAIDNANGGMKRLREIHNERDKVWGEITEEPRYKRSRKADIQRLTRPDIKDLEVEATSLRGDFEAAKTQGDENVINIRGGELLTHLKRQSEIEAFLARAPVLDGIYPTARGDLIRNIGQYCSYCEMPLAASLAVEHMLPKADFPNLTVAWTNLLLGCPSCNSTKSNKPSLNDAINRAQRDHGTNTVTPDQIVDAGYRLMLWPSDSANHYSNFTNCFQYILRKAHYDARGEVVNWQELTTQETYQRLMHNTIFFDSETGDDVIARFYDDLGPINVASAIIYLQGLPLNTDTVASAAPAEFKKAISELGINLDDPGAAFTIKAGSPYPQDAPDHASWTLTETRRHEIDMLGPRAQIMDGRNATSGSTLTPVSRVAPFR